MQHINISVSNDEKNFYGKDEYETIIAIKKIILMIFGII